MKKTLFLIGFVFLSNVTLFSQIDYSSVDTTVIPNGIFSELLEKFHAVGNQKVVYLDYDSERKMIIFAIEWKGYLEAGTELMLIEQTDSGLVRRVFTGYSPNFKLHFTENYLYVKTERRIEILNLNEIAKPITVPYILDYKLSSRLFCPNEIGFDCISLELVDNKRVILKKRNRTTEEIVEETYLIENGKLIKI